MSEGRAGFPRSERAKSTASSRKRDSTGRPELALGATLRLAEAVRKVVCPKRKIALQIRCLKRRERKRKRLCSLPFKVTWVTLR